jgi:hypothetical protein
MTLGETYTVLYGAESVEVVLDSASVGAGSGAGGFGSIRGGFGGGQGGFGGSWNEDDMRDSEQGVSSEGFRQGGPGRRGGMGDMQGMPEDFVQDGRPEMPEGFAPGEKPENVSGSAVTPPDGPQDRGGPGAGMQRDMQSEAEEEIASSSALSLNDYSYQTWIWLGASAAALFAGLLFAKRWQRC